MLPVLKMCAKDQDFTVYFANALQGYTDLRRLTCSNKAIDPIDHTVETLAYLHAHYPRCGP
jgi:hypothetical protein